MLKICKKIKKKKKKKKKKKRVSIMEKQINFNK